MLVTTAPKKGKTQIFILKSQAAIEKAIERTRSIRPRACVNSLGEYAVQDHCGNFYTVRCERRGGQKVVDCSCPAGQHSTPCYQSASVIGVHMALAQAAQ